MVLFNLLIFFFVIKIKFIFGSLCCFKWKDFCIMCLIWLWLWVCLRCFLVMVKFRWGFFVVFKWVRSVIWGVLVWKGFLNIVLNWMGVNKCSFWEKVSVFIFIIVGD